MEYKMEYRLTDLCELIMGQSPDSSSCNKDGKGIPFYQGNADFGEKNPTPRNWCLQPKKIAQKDDILISVRAPIGDLNIANEDCCIGRGVAAIRMKSKECDRDYLYLFLESKSKYLQDCGTGSTFTAINKGVLESLKVKCPELKNQTSIANEIENIKAAIKYKNSELICLNEAVQSEFVEMFGSIIENSEKIALEKICDFVTVGIANSATHAFCENGVIMFRNQNIKEDFLDDSDVIYIRQDFADRYKSKALKENDLLIVRTGYPGVCCLVPKKYEGCQTFTTLIARLKEKKDINPKFICHYINSKYGKEYVEKNQAGVAQQNFGATALSKMPMVIPPINLQNKFAAFVQQIDKSKFVVKQQIADLQELLDSKMQEYFS